MTDPKPTITPEALNLLVERAGLKLLPKLEQLCRAYTALEQMKALVRKPRSYDYEPAHIFNQLPELDSPNLTMPFNVTGLPALAICCGFDAKGLPLSMQIIGKPFDETTISMVGHAYEQATSWRQCRPELGAALTIQRAEL